MICAAQNIKGQVENRVWLTSKKKNFKAADALTKANTTPGYFFGE